MLIKALPFIFIIILGSSVSYLSFLDPRIDVYLNWDREGYGQSVSIVLSAVVFAAFHLFMEVYSFPIFSQRVVGGILLGSLFYTRGYGISVYAHIIYNFLILADSW